MTHASDVVHFHNIERWRDSPLPYDNNLGSKETLIPEPRSPPSSTPISMIWLLFGYNLYE